MLVLDEDVLKCLCHPLSWLGSVLNLSERQHNHCIALVPWRATGAIHLLWPSFHFVRFQIYIQRIRHTPLHSSMPWYHLQLGKKINYNKNRSGPFLRDRSELGILEPLWTFKNLQFVFNEFISRSSLPLDVNLPWFLPGFCPMKDIALVLGRGTGAIRYFALVPWRGTGVNFAFWTILLCDSTSNYIHLVKHLPLDLFKSSSQRNLARTRQNLICSSGPLLRDRSDFSPRGVSVLMKIFNLYSMERSRHSPSLPIWNSSWLCRNSEIFENELPSFTEGQERFCSYRPK